MLLVIGCWTLAMVAGLSWARWYTGLFTGVTLVAFVATQPWAFAGWAGWLEGATLGLTPWLLAAQRSREQLGIKELHQQEAVQMSELSETARSVLSLQSSTQQMETQITEITDLYHVTKETVRALRVSELFAACLNIAPRLLNASGLRLIDLSGQAPQVLRATRSADGRMVPPPGASPKADLGLLAESPARGGAAPGGGMVPQPSAGEGVVTDGNQPIEMERAIIQQAVSSGRSSSATARELHCAVPDGISRIAWVLLRREQQPVGVLVADELPDDQLKTLAIVADQLSLQFSRILLYQQVEALAVTDALTGLTVRGYFMERAREELARSKRHGLSCTLLMTDLDLFKLKNDTFGHLVGDVILKEVARLLQGNLREIDLIARFGGEEFILLLIETGVEHAMPITERLRQLVEAHPIRAYDEVLTQTISIGVAGFPEHGDTVELLIERADQALYAAKRAGRNRVVRWTEQRTSV